MKIKLNYKIGNNLNWKFSNFIPSYAMIIQLNLFLEILNDFYDFSKCHVFTKENYFVIIFKTQIIEIHNNYIHNKFSYDYEYIDILDSHKLIEYFEKCL